MRVNISGKQIDIGSALQTHVSDEIDGIIDKFSTRATDANVTFSKDGHEFMSEVAIHLTSGLTVNAQARANEIYASFDSAADKMEKQLRRYKRRLKDHHTHRASPVEVSEASAYILAGNDGAEEANEPETLNPVIIAELETGIQSLSVGEAVMQMELADENVLVFRNEGHKGLNVVYRRKDGNIGWVDPQ